MLKPMSIIDLLALIPFYLEISFEYMSVGLEIHAGCEPKAKQLTLSVPCIGSFLPTEVR